jgi:thiamine biosynthesis lipoprotein
MFDFHFRSMNTHIQVSVEAELEERGILQEQVTQWFYCVERTFSRFLKESELARLNRNAGMPCMVSDLMLEVLQLAEDYQSQTEGLFSVFVYDALRNAGYHQTFESLRGKVGNQTSQSSVTNNTTNGFRLDPIMKSIRTGPDQRMDLGGIVKSWSVRKIVEWLQKEWEIPRGLVNAGGDLVVWGQAAENQPWVVGIANPWTGKDELCLLLSDGAVATSSTWHRKWSTPKGEMHHLIDPRTMSPSTSTILQCTVVGMDVVACEIWAKVICIAGLELGIQLLRQRTRHMEALMFTSEGKIHFYGSHESLANKWNHARIDVQYERNEEKEVV